MCLLVCGCNSSKMVNESSEVKESYEVYPIGKVVRREGRTLIVVDKKYQEGLMGMEEFSEVTVVYWFDRNDTPKQRAILQVHPHGNPCTPTTT